MALLVSGPADIAIMAAISTTGSWNDGEDREEMLDWRRPMRRRGQRKEGNYPREMEERSRNRAMRIMESLLHLTAIDPRLPVGRNKASDACQHRFSEMFFRP